MTIIDYVDDYNQRYVTVFKQVTLGTEIITEIYVPYVYGQDINVRRLNDSIEVLGIITIITQVFDKSNKLIAEGIVHDVNWIEVWKKCWAKPMSKFKYHLDCAMVDTADSEVTSGPAFVSPDSSNDVIWGDVDIFGNVIAAGVGETNLSYIDIWS